MSDAIYVSIGSFLFGFFGLGLGGVLLLAFIKRRADWSAKSLVHAFTVGFLAWGFYQFIMFLRFFLEYVLSIPAYEAFSLSLTTKLTDNPFMFGINPLGYLWINPLQALVTWAIEILSAGAFIYTVGAMILRE